MTNNGWVKLHKKIRESEVFRDTNAYHVFSLLLVSSDNNGKGKLGRFTASGELQMNPSTFYKALKRLEKKYHLVTLSSNNKVTSFSLNNWCKYQSVSNSESNNKVTTGEQLGNTVLRIKNKNKELNTKEISNTNSQNNFVEGVQQKFGNQFTNIGLEIFEETFGFKPIDLKPRNEAYTFYRSVQALLKRYNINITEAPERYKKLLTGYFTWLSDDDIGAGIQTMSGARRHFRKYEPKIINILERKNGLQEKTN